MARSAEISSVVVLFAGMMLLSANAADILNQYADVTRGAFLQLTVRDERPEAVLSLAMSMMASSALVLAPVMMGVALAGVAINLVQVGPMFSTEVLRPNLSKLNPIAGLQRMWSPRILVELLKAAVKLSVVAFVAYQVIREREWMLAGLQTASAQGALAIVGSIALEIAQKCGVALLVMAAADYVYQRRSVESSLKMTKEEVREEAKQAEGNPQVKGKLRSLQRQLARSRMMQAVPHADVVVTNPTHYAVALEYKPPSMQAPVVVAKGQNLIAEQIKRVAREHGVPVVENPPLARALHSSVEIGDAIPPAMYQAVAEVLAFIYRLREQHSSAGSFERE